MDFPTDSEVNTKFNEYTQTYPEKYKQYKESEPQYLKNCDKKRSLLKVNV